MERCLKKLVLEAKAMGFGDSEKGGWEPLAANTALEGFSWRQMGIYSQQPESQKINSGLSNTGEKAELFYFENER